MILILAGALLLACGGALGVLVLVAIRVDVRHMSLTDESRTCERTAARRLLGVYVRQAGHALDLCDQARR